MTDSSSPVPTAPAPTRLRAAAIGRGRLRRGSGAGALAALAALAVAGCGGLDPVVTHEQITDPAQLYMRLTIEPSRAVNLATLAPYNTQQLTATPRNALGDALTGLPAPTFRLSRLADSLDLTVTPDGLLQARQSRFSPVVIIAELAIPGNVRHADTALIQINATTDPPPHLDSLALDPMAPDSTKRAMDMDFNDFDFFLMPFDYVFHSLPTPRALDSGGNPISDYLLFDVTVLDPAIASFSLTATSFDANLFIDTDVGMGLNARRPGQARFLIRTTAYGVTRADTQRVTVTWPAIKRVDLVTEIDGVTRFRPSELRIAPYGMVLWRNFLTDTMDVTFEDPTNVGDAAEGPPGPGPVSMCNRLNDINLSRYTHPGSHCGPGNILIPGYPTDTTLNSPDTRGQQLRQFRVPGVYPFHNTRTGASGQIIVTADPDPTALP